MPKIAAGSLFATWEDFFRWVADFHSPELADKCKTYLLAYGLGTSADPLQVLSEVTALESRESNEDLVDLRLSPCNSEIELVYIPISH